MVFRTQLGAAAVSRSMDDGETWSYPLLLTVRLPEMCRDPVTKAASLDIICRPCRPSCSPSLCITRSFCSSTSVQADNPDSKPNLINIWPNGEVLMAFNDHTKENIACKNCRSKLSISRLVNATGAWDHVAQFGPSPSDFLKVKLPSRSPHHSPGCGTALSAPGAETPASPCHIPAATRDPNSVRE